MLPSSIRVRFAPSPTGHLHIGGLRTALFNWLFAKNQGGKFLLRIEDTDLERSKPEYIHSILDSLAWAGLESDEPIVIQTEALDRHQALAHQLIATGHAYKCYCPKIEYIDGSYTKYNGQCRNLPSDNDLSGPYVIRLKLPAQCNSVSFDDIIRGTVIFDADQLDDFIIVRSDGIPTYNFVVVADDIAMRITHIIRGEEHISNTPRQILIYQALQQPLPLFAHLPMILGPSGAKLSKRDAATSVLEYKTQGYLADGLSNYLVRLGWSHGDQEIFTREEMIAYFNLKSIGSKGAIFDKNKLDWVNSVYIKAATPEFLLTHIIKDVDQKFLSKVHWPSPIITSLIELYKDRVKTLGELVNEIIELHSYTFSKLNTPDFINSQTIALVRESVGQLQELHSFHASEIQVIIKKLINNYNLKLVALAQPLRFILTGKTAAPGVFELMNSLGKQESMKRLIHFLNQYPQ